MGRRWGPSPLTVTSPARPGGAPALQLGKEAPPGPQAQPLSQSLQICCSGPPCLPPGPGGLVLWPPEGRAAKSPWPPTASQGLDARARGPWLETVPWSGPATRPHGQEMPGARGGAHTGGGGLMLLQARAGAPGTAKKGPLGHPGARPSPGEQAELESPPGGRPPLGNRARCYLKGPRPRARQARGGRAGQWLPRCQGLRNTCRVLGSTARQSPSPCSSIL